VKKARRLRVKVTITVSATGRKPVVTTRTVAVRPAKPKKG
jgi:hypothetical protein